MSRCPGQGGSPRLKDSLEHTACLQEAAVLSRRLTGQWPQSDRPTRHPLPLFLQLLLSMGSQACVVMRLPLAPPCMARGSQVCPGPCVPPPAHSKLAQKLSPLILSTPLLHPGTQKEGPAQSRWTEREKDEHGAVGAHGACHPRKQVLLCLFRFVKDPDPLKPYP